MSGTETPQEEHDRSFFEPGFDPERADRAVIGGQYRVVRRLDRTGGGFAVLAEDESTHELVSIDFVEADPGNADDVVGRARDSARRLAGVGGDGVAKTLDVVEYRGRIGIVSQALDGTELVALLRSGPLPLGRAAGIGRSVATTLGALHEAGIPHGAVSPHSIVVDDSGTARLTSPVLGATTQLVGITAADAVYAAPETTNDHETGSASDMYSLGAVLYEMVVGQPPFANWDDSLVAEQKVREQPAPPSASATLVPPEFDALVLRLLDSRPIARPSAEETAVALRRLEVPAAQTRPAPVPRRRGSVMVTESIEDQPRSIGPWIALGAVVAILATLVGVWLANRDDSQARAVPSVVGQSAADATATLRNVGFQVSSVELASSTVPVGIVAKQSPASGAQLDENSTVVITVSTGLPPTIPAPAPPVVIQPTSPSSTSTTTSTTSTSTTTATAPPGP